jgi:hypothetical protein
MADQRRYDQGLRPRILINWQSFTAQGIDPAWQGPFAEAVQNAYTRCPRRCRTHTPAG